MRERSKKRLSRSSRTISPKRTPSKKKLGACSRATHKHPAMWTPTKCFCWRNRNLPPNEVSYCEIVGGTNLASCSPDHERFEQAKTCRISQRAASSSRNQTSFERFFSPRGPDQRCRPSQDQLAIPSCAPRKP